MINPSENPLFSGISPSSLLLSPTAITVLLFSSTASYKKSISLPPTVSCQTIFPSESTLIIKASF